MINMQNKENNVIRIHVYELRIGMCVCRLETPQQKPPFSNDRFDIKTQADIQAIQAVCDYVYINVKWQKENNGDTLPQKTESKKYLSFARSFEQSAHTYQQTSRLIKATMDDIRFGNQLNTKAVKETVSECVNKVLEDSSAILLLTQLKDQHEYTAQHSVNVCIFAILLGRELKLSIQELNNIGLCGLMHDIGKMKVPVEILNKPGKLNDDEMAIMRQHPVFGRNILISTPDIYPGTVEVAHDHHKHLDGTGYPRDFDKAELTIFTKIVTIVDTYDAVTSDRAYQKSQSHLKALDILVKGMNTEYDAELVIQFINCIGFYPQGNLVELNSGEIGLVVEQNKRDKLKPKLLLILDKNKKHMNERILDLELNTTDSSKVPYKIKNIVRPQDYNIDLIKFYRDGKLTKNYSEMT